MAGSVAQPGKKSHLELKTSHGPLSREVMSLMLDSSIEPRCTERASSTLIYLKETARIEDFLTLIGASGAAMAIMEAKLKKTFATMSTGKSTAKPQIFSKPRPLPSAR